MAESLQATIRKKAGPQDVAMPEKEVKYFQERQIKTVCRQTDASTRENVETAEPGPWASGNFSAGFFCAHALEEGPGGVAGRARIKTASGEARFPSL